MPAKTYAGGINGILAALKGDLKVANADAIIMDGKLGEQFSIGLTELRQSEEGNRVVTRLMRETCIEVGEMPKAHRLFNAHWGPTYDKFVEYLNGKAEDERRAAAVTTK